MGIFLGTSEPSKIFVGGSEVASVRAGDTKVRPSFTPRTFTISRTEQQTMTSGWTYSDDAAGLTAGSGDFDDFFGYSAVLLNTSGVETAEMKQSGGVFTGAMTTLGNITSGDNVMIKFPVRGIKMTKSGSVVTLSITNELDKDGYQYYAFNRNGTRGNQFYLGAYMGSKVTQNGTQYLRSYSGKSAAADAASDGITNLSLDDACTLSQKNAGYDIETWYQRQYINALYMMKYGNPNSQSVVGMGYVGDYHPKPTGATDSITNATGATNTSTTGRIKLFGLEDRWGNIEEWLNGCYFDGSYYFNMSTLQNFTSGRIKSFDKKTGARDTWIKNIVGDNSGMFYIKSGGGGKANYYCDYCQYYLDTGASAGGAYSNGSNATYLSGAFTIYAHSTYDAYYGARLMYV